MGDRQGPQDGKKSKYAKTALLQTRSEIRQALDFILDHEIVRAYRAIERATEMVDKAIAEAEERD